MNPLTWLAGPAAKSWTIRLPPPNDWTVEPGAAKTVLPLPLSVMNDPGRVVFGEEEFADAAKKVLLLEPTTAWKVPVRLSVVCWSAAASAGLNPRPSMFRAAAKRSWGWPA